MVEYIKSTERVGEPYFYVDQKKHSVSTNKFPEHSYSAEFQDVYCDTLNIKDSIKVNDEDIEDVIEDIAKDVSKDVYSTTETVVGTWVDGKTIYRQVQSFGTITGQTTGTAISNVDQVVRLWGAAFSPQYSQWYSLPNVHSSITNYYVGILLDNQSRPMVRFGSSFTSLQKVYVIVEYTKTND